MVAGLMGLIGSCIFVVNASESDQTAASTFQPLSGSFYCAIIGSPLHIIAVVLLLCGWAATEKDKDSVALDHNAVAPTTKKVNDAVIFFNNFLLKLLAKNVFRREL